MSALEEVQHADPGSGTVPDLTPHAARLLLEGGAQPVAVAGMLLDAGRVVAHGRIVEVLANPRLEEFGIDLGGEQ